MKRFKLSVAAMLLLLAAATTAYGATCSVSECGDNAAYWEQWGDRGVCWYNCEIAYCSNAEAVNLLDDLVDGCDWDPFPVACRATYRNLLDDACWASNYEFESCYDYCDTFFRVEAAAPPV